MSTRQKPPRQNAGRAPIRKHAVPSVGTEKTAPGFFLNPPLPGSKRKRAALEAAVYNANKNRTPTNG